VTAQATAPRCRISVCVPTRNRGARIGAALESLKRLDHDSYEVIVVDQSTDDLTRLAFEQTVGADPRFALIPSTRVGKSVACNIALAAARGAIVAFTDDDCEAPGDWLSGIERGFASHPEVAMICGGVRAAAHDPAVGAIPTFLPRHTRVLSSPWLAFRSQGIGANLAFRSAELRRAGAFDEVLGVGAVLRAGEDRDIAYRFLRAGHGILELPEPAVLHRGLRTWGKELRDLAWDAAFSEGATYMKHLRLGDPVILPTFIIRGLFGMVTWRNLLLLRQPTGLGRIPSFARGARMSFRFPIDADSRRYRGPRLERVRSAPG
jgi:glycosyltransferase involved in cell wall biosynthesis